MFMIREGAKLREADEVSKDAFNRLTPEQMKKVRATAVQALAIKTKEQNPQN
jgi:hypothetical protein